MGDEERMAAFWVLPALAAIRRLEGLLSDAEHRIASLQREVDHWQREAAWRAATVLGETARSALVEGNRANALASAIGAHRDAVAGASHDRDEALYRALRRSEPTA